MRRPPTADLMLLTTVVIWGFNFTASKYVLTHGFSPLSYPAVRYGAAGVLLAVLTASRERSLGLRRSDWLRLSLASLLGIAGNQAAFNYGIRLTTASTAALIFGTLPLWTGLVASLVGFERLSRRFWAAAAISFAGVALVAVGSGGELGGDLGGDLLILLSTVTWAGYTVAIAPLMRRYSPLRVSALTLLVGVAPLLAIGSGQLAAQDWALGAAVWGTVLFAVVVALVLTNVLWFSAIHRVGPSRATLFVNLQPFLAAVVAVLLLSESLSALQVAGGVTIAAGLLSARRPRHPEAAPTE